jgi:hypothetical protein
MLHNESPFVRPFLTPWTMEVIARGRQTAVPRFELV